MRVLISGANRGLGRALCEEALSRHWEVIPWVRSASVGAQVDQNSSLISDVTDFERVREQIAHWAPLVDGLILNAGTSELLRPDHGHSADRALEVIQVNTSAVIFASYRMAYEWIRLGLRDKKIVLISSLIAGRGLPRSAVYGASKTALLSFAQGFAQDLAPFGISVVVVQPGFVETDMTKDLRYKPFLMGASEAARIILDGLEKGQFQVAFPTKLVWISRLKEFMPYDLWRILVRFLHRKKVL